MDGPGFTLFQGGGSINVAGNGHNVEEEEDVEDRKRRAAELGNQLENAFDDMGLDDDHDTLDNTYQSNYNLSFHKQISSGNGDGKEFSFHYKRKNENCEKDEMNNVIYRLQMEVEARNRDLDHVNKLMVEERQTFNTKLNELSKKVSLAEAERERLNMSKCQTHELLVESKTKISDLEASLHSLKEKNKLLEQSKSQLMSDLENAKTMLNDSEMKCRLIEKEVGKSSQNHRNEAAYKKMADRSNGQIEMMQQQIENLQSKLEEKENEVKSFQIRLSDLQKSREILMMEKTETINKLNRNLEDAQKQCVELFKKAESNEESKKLKDKISSLEDHIDHLQQAVNDLLKQLDMKLDFAHSTEIVPKLKENSINLFQELQQTKEFTDKIDKLENEVRRLKEEENKILIKYNESQLEISKLNQKLKILKDNTSELENKKEIDSLKNKINELTCVNQKLTESNKELKDLSSSITKSRETDQDTINEKLKLLEENRATIEELESQIKELKSHVKTVKVEYENKIQNLEAKFKTEKNTFTDLSNSCLKCMQQMNDITKLEIQNMHLQNDCFTYLKQIKSLKSDEKVVNRKEAGTTTEKPNSRDVGVMASSETSSSESEQEINKKKNVIDEYAKISAKEIKKMEEKFKSHLISTQNLLISKNKEVEEITDKHLKQIEMLKMVVLSEREEYERLLKNKEEIIAELIEKIQEMTRNVRDPEEIKSLTRELEEKQREIENERHSMMVLQTQWKEEKKQLLTTEAEIKKKLEKMTENYRSAKKTAENYKRYTEEKDEFMNREVENLKAQYQNAIIKIRQKYDNLKKKTSL